MTPRWGGLGWDAKANQKTYQEYRAATPQLIHEYLLVALAAAGVGVVYMQ